MANQIPEIALAAIEDAVRPVIESPEQTAELRRLFESAHILEIEIPFASEEILKAWADTVRANGLKECPNDHGLPAF